MSEATLRLTAAEPVVVDVGEVTLAFAHLDELSGEPVKRFRRVMRQHDKLRSAAQRVDFQAVAEMARPFLAAALVDGDAEVLTGLGAWSIYRIFTHYSERMVGKDVGQTSTPPR